MNLNDEQYNELKEKLAQEIIDSIDKTAGEEESPQLTEEQIKAILAAKKAEIAKREGAAAENSDNGEEIESKAMAVYEYALNKIAACEEMYQEATLDKQACIESLVQAGLVDENGLNKQAAEENEETALFTNTVAEVYDDAINKIAASEECYAEAIDELNAATEVLADCGYEF